MKMKQGSYCRKRTKKCLTQIFPALIFLLIAAACGVLSAVRLKADKTGWEYKDYFTLAVSAVITAVGLILGVYEIYTGVRDALFPANSRLAKSIRAQLPGPNVDLPVEELFGIVDQDLNEHGIWFSGDRAGVGHEWVLSDDAVYIPRIRVACGRDEISRSNSGSRSSRVVAFYLLDDRKKPHSKVLHNPSELQAFLDCLKLRAPDVFFCSYQEYLSCRTKSDIEWEEVLQGFRHRKNERELRILEAERAANSNMQNTTAGGPDSTASSWVMPDLAGQEAQQSMPPCLFLIAASGARQCHETFEREDVEIAAEGLIDGSYRNVQIHTKAFCWMVIEAENMEEGRFHVGVTRPDADKLRFYSAECSHRQAAIWLMDFYEGRLDTGSIQWRDDTKQMEKNVRKEMKKRRNE